MGGIRESGSASIFFNENTMVFMRGKIGKNRHGIGKFKVSISSNNCTMKI
jgi:hypothetical protein